MQNSIVRPLGRDMQNVLIGFVGEHEARTFFVRTRDDLTGYTVGLVIDDVDCGAMTKAPMPDGSIMLSLTLTSDMLGKGGDKVCQLLMTKDTIVRKSSQFRAYVGASNDINSTAPDSATIIIISEKITELVHEAALDAIAEVQEIIGSIPSDYSELSAQVDTNTEDISGLKADLKYIRTVSEITNSLFEKGGWSNGSKGTYRQANRARTATKLYALKDFNISKNDGSTSIIYTEFYKQDGTVNRTVTWSAAIYIEKGSIFTLTVTPSNSGTAAETDIETILAGVTITGLNKSIILSTEDAFTTLQGIPTSTNLLIRHDYASRITITDYFKTGEKFLYVDCDSDYKFFVVAYDSNFNVVLYGSGYGNGWETGQVFKDYSKYAYVRFALSKQNDETISVDEISHLKISQNASENINRWSLISIAKDGINDSNKDYAPKYPKSSLISLKKAYERGFRDIALHVQVTSDNIPVVFHDQSINRYARNADGSAISGTVNISTSTLAKLDTYDFGIMFDEQYRGTKITRLEDALKLCKYLGVKIWIEPTVSLGDAKETLVFDMIKQYGLDDKMAFFSYYVSTLSRVHGKVPESDLYYWPNAVTDISTNIDALKALIDKNNVYVFTYAETAIPEETRLAMKNAGVRRIVQVLEGTEPNNIESALVSNLDCDGVESQVVPAYMAALKLT